MTTNISEMYLLPKKFALLFVTPSVLRPKQIIKPCHGHHAYVIMYVIECVDNIFVTSDDQ